MTNSIVIEVDEMGNKELKIDRDDLGLTIPQMYKVGKEFGRVGRALYRDSVSEWSSEHGEDVDVVVFVLPLHDEIFAGDAEIRDLAERIASDFVVLAELAKKYRDGLTLAPGAFRLSLGESCIGNVRIEWVE